jgi:hypothetical protein
LIDRILLNRWVARAGTASFLLGAGLFIWQLASGRDSLLLVAVTLLGLGVLLLVNPQVNKLRRGRIPAVRLAAISRQLGTELRAIRHKIDILRTTRPHPHYSHEFHLPAYRWDEFDEELSADAKPYRIVEHAYNAAHHVNEALDMRRTRARPNATLGVIPDDGLDEAYEAAGEALDALGEPRGEVWETGAERAVRLVVDDIMREMEEGEAKPSE